MTAYTDTLNVDPEARLVAIEFTTLKNSWSRAGQILRTVPDTDAVMDVLHNRVLVNLPKEQAQHASQLEQLPGVEIEWAAKRRPPLEPGDGTCTSRQSCGWPVRGGIGIGKFNSSGGGSTTVTCTLGFAANASDGSRWVLTAGHCPTRNDILQGVVYGHGEKAFGPVRSRCYWYDGTCSYSAVDVSRVRVDSTYWKLGWGGYLWAGPGSRVDIDYAIAYMSTLSNGMALCKSALSDDPGVDNCGVIDDVSSVNGVHVSGIHVCHGDSGGPMYLITSGQRWGVGVFSLLSSPTCDTDLTMSPLPLINEFFDGTSAATVRVVYQ